MTAVHKNMALLMFGHQHEMLGESKCLFGADRQATRHHLMACRSVNLLGCTICQKQQLGTQQIVETVPQSVLRRLRMLVPFSSILHTLVAVVTRVPGS
jgi:hypothetical protein